MTQIGIPPKQGLYDPQFEHDACGIGFVVNIKGKKSHAIVEQALTILENLNHRGARGCEEETGDGAGILFQVPHPFFQHTCATLGIRLPEAGQYGVGMIFLPPDTEQRCAIEQRFEAIVREEGQEVLGWRDVPVDNSDLGKSAKAREPVIRQIFIGRNAAVKDTLAFERKLYVIRRRAARVIRYGGGMAGGQYFYAPSVSSRTIIYKGMLTPGQVGTFYRDLSDPLMESAIAIVHSRFSTNTFPSWERSHPYRYLIHNGEINTLRGNENWMHARQAMLASPLFGDDLRKLFPIMQEDGSDSSKFDNCLEFLVLSGRSLPHAVMMMIPEPWEGHENMNAEKRAFYEYHSSLMEPWDGPASIGFTDGIRVGAVLDRNGLRPSRYYVTKDDLLILASEVGVLDVPPDMVLEKRRLQPGRMLLVDTEKGRIISDEEIKQEIATAYPYGEWITKHTVHFDDLPTPKDAEPVYNHRATLQRQQAFGYNFEDLKVNIGPMAQNGIQPIGSMGTDTPLAVLSDRPQLLYNYFKQLFAQVTNPPIDPIREELITSTTLTIGSEGNLIDPQPNSCHQLRLSNPILKNSEMEKLRQLDQPGIKSVTLPMLFNPKAGKAGLEQTIETLYQAADKAIANGATILILSDKGVDRAHAAIPALLASAGLHHHLIRTGTRTRVGLVLESGEPREVHHFCLLLGYGIQAFNPYMAYECLNDMIHEGMLNLTYYDAVKGYNKAVVKGVVKVMAKMGISTIKSYCGAQIFEAVGLGQELIDKYFTWTPSRLGGIGIDAVAREAVQQHAKAFPEIPLDGHTLEVQGQYQYRADGELHLFNPKTIHLLQKSSRTNNYASFKEYSKLIDDQSERMATLRGLMKLRFAAKPIPIEEVEPVESIVKRFKTGAMSYGSISKEAHESLAIAMNRIGGKSNTGEGGEDPARYTLDVNGDSRNSAIKQVASGRFGVTSYYLTQAKELQIKMAQGAKPGEGGELPGRKVYPWIAKVRHSTPGVGLISPPPHHDIYSIEDLAQLIHDLKNANDKARISVKLVSEIGVGTIAAGVAKGHADVVLISGHDGGTGASPQTSIKHAGLPWELGVAETHQTLVLNNLRSRIVIETDGQLKTGRDVIIAALLGAEEFGFATTGLVVLGCIMMRVCHLDTCPVGIATQNPELRKKFGGDPGHVVNFMYMVAQEMREHMAQLGFRTVNEMIGRTDKLEMSRAVEHWKTKGLDYSAMLYQPQMGPEVGRYCQIAQNHGLANALDNQVLLKLAQPALERQEKVEATLPIRNINRVVGTLLGSEVTRRFGPKGLHEDTIHFRFQGSAGQSFGAFIPRGMLLELEGDANDYCGKGLSGGKIVAYPPAGSTFVPEDNIIIGNVAFYGATGGEAYIRGMAGERFGVRNSGVWAVVEGVGDHGCEYMTGGRVVVLGKTGRNFAAGMSGGVAYVLDEDSTFASHCNQETVSLERMEEWDIQELEKLIWKHVSHTNSDRARHILTYWNDFAPKFVKVMPKDYKRMLEAVREAEQQGHMGDEAVMAAFEANKNDAARVSGN